MSSYPSQPYLFSGDIAQRADGRLKGIRTPIDIAAASISGKFRATTLASRHSKSTLGLPALRWVDPG